MTEHDILIREFRYPDDYPQTADLWRSMEKGVSFSRSDVPAEIEKKMRHDPDLFLVAELGGVVVGTVIGGFDGRRGMVYHLAVASMHRRKGIADLLMKELEQRLIAKGAIRAYLLVAAENHEARALYEKLDWNCLDLNLVYVKDLA